VETRQAGHEQADSCGGGRATLREKVCLAALMTHLVPELSRDAVVSVMRVLAARSIGVLVSENELAKHGAALEPYGSLVQVTDESTLGQVDVCLVLGGDGTMLRALRLFGPCGVPVAGMNLGRVSFFATIDRTCVEHDVGRVLEGDFCAYGLPALEACVEEHCFTALNDVVVSRPAGTNVVELSFVLAGVEFPGVRCDGLIAATPAGSSAYNLSAGGPFLGIGLDGFVVSFISPHSLWTRPIVAAGSDAFVVRNSSAHERADLFVDGEPVLELFSGSSLALSMRKDAAVLALLPGASLYRNFRDRFVGRGGADPNR